MRPKKGERLKDAKAEVVRLWGSLLHYGRHTSDCRYYGGFDCSCGWDELRDVAKTYATPNRSDDK